jgi:hypothetical protein
MNLDNDIILVKTSDRKYGIPVSRINYEIIRDFIFTVLKHEKEITLTALIERSEQILAQKISGNLGWYIIHVKQDMESKSQITTTWMEGKKRIQVIRQKKPRLRMMS